jgi:hypothetical protein
MKYYIHYSLENYNPEIEDYDMFDEIYQEFNSLKQAVKYCKEENVPKWVKIKIRPKPEYIPPVNLGNYYSDEF